MDDKDKDLPVLVEILPSDTIKLIFSENEILELTEEQIKIQNLKSFRITNKDEASKFDMELKLFVSHHERKIDLSNPSVEPFKLPSGYDELSQQAVNFRRLLSNAVYQYGCTDAIPLDILFEKYSAPEDYNNFLIFLDVKINFANCSAKVHDMIATHYKNLHLNSKSDLGLVFYSERIEMQYAAQSLIMNLRATWDKIMGMIIFLDSGRSEYENFLEANKRKRFFSRRYPDGFSQVVDVITILDQDFRTQEAHQSGGKIRNNSLSNGLLSDNYLLKIIGHYNFMHEFLDSNYNWIFRPKE
ncbi:hypothetical protein [Enterococcus gallinarum]|uniref:hypothetical protein n=1 Tax=Enterococcus gallinarum TaxID=1353 RepID=UPI0022E5F1B3|nr:hypothetical protein [Enterococcus gallinarum]